MAGATVEELLHKSVRIGCSCPTHTGGATVEASANCLVHTYGKKGAATRGSLYDFAFRRIDGALKNETGASGDGVTLDILQPFPGRWL